MVIQEQVTLQKVSLQSKIASRKKKEDRLAIRGRNRVPCRDQDYNGVPSTGGDGLTSDDRDSFPESLLNRDLNVCN